MLRLEIASQDKFTRNLHPLPASFRRDGGLHMFGDSALARYTSAAARILRPAAARAATRRLAQHSRELYRRPAGPRLNNSTLRTGRFARRHFRMRKSASSRLWVETII